MQDYIKAFFDYLEDRVRFLAELYSAGRQDEAATLCCVYIDGLANCLWPNEPSKRNFVRALTEYGHVPQMSLLHPHALFRWLRDSDRPKLTALAPKVQAAFAPAHQPMEEAPFHAALTANLSKEELQLIEKDLWRASIAAIAYDRVRVPWVHRLQGYGAVTFDASLHEGKPLPSLDFALMHTALTSIAASARELSERTDKFFGHNFAGVGWSP